MRVVHGLAALIVGLLVWSAEAAAAIVVRVDKSTQTMRVIVDGEHRYTWAVSTGRAGYNTPNGTYAPQRLERSWYSRKYGMAPMPHSIRS
ncbi:L,D-transpeptidase [Phreatobacter oligotrophus]|jgi:lipoprotein-anchoring transpeptidase ErfK/SrfK|uniref:L,D-transpeptidase-like protein n=1 Tax=Phreatobacter oligotrophus TaxID=1122261 RepID=A0A2T4YXL3_9HYPH|nr:L,D-transpeptidase [Phreatobacter oligotrophus]PTM51075.1 L,D-transpeptidase-like protein [Phreatobacter oligotrophus]